jgi:hypothetical protein
LVACQPADPRTQTFGHEILLYPGGASGFIASTLPLVLNALDTNQPILIAARSERTEPLREALGDDASRVRFADMHVLGRNPGRIISAWRDFLETDCADAPYALGIGEPVWPGRSAAELDECERHEALLNLAFAGGQPWRLVCPYDLDGLPDGVIDAARCTHPFVTGEHDASPNSDYLCASQPPNALDGTLPDPRAAARTQAFAGERDLAVMRRFLSTWAGEQTERTDLGDRLVLAVNELATNSIRYGAGAGQVLAWRESDTLM